VEFSEAAAVFFQGLKDEEAPWDRTVSPWEDFQKENRLTTIGETAKWLAKVEKNDGGRLLVAKRNGKIIGISGLIIREKSAGMFTGVVVSKQERQKGVGTVLLHHTLLEAQKQGAEHVEIWTIPRITAAIHLYPKFGGVETLTR